MSRYDKRKRTFWHETGHFVGGIYNQQLHGCYGAESVFIRWSADHNDYHGDTNINPALGYLENGTPIYPAARIASTAYGCIFQAIQYNNKVFKDCFDNNRYAKGWVDFGNIRGIAFRYKIIDPELVKPIWDCISAHFEKVKDNPEFAALFEKNIDHLIDSEEDTIQVDLDEVNKVLADFLPIHQEYYFELVRQLDEIFQPHMV